MSAHKEITVQITFSEKLFSSSSNMMEAFGMPKVSFDQLVEETNQGLQVLDGGDTKISVNPVARTITVEMNEATIIQLYSIIGKHAGVVKEFISMVHAAVKFAKVAFKPLLADLKAFQTGTVLKADIDVNNVDQAKGLLGKFTRKPKNE